MNYEISQIKNFESCNAGITTSIINDAITSVITENWQHNIALAEAFTDKTIDIKAEMESVNDCLKEAGCETRVDESDVTNALGRWVEMETIKGNI